VFIKAVSRCDAVCSSRRLTSPLSCNLYFIEAGVCTLGVMDNFMALAKPVGSAGSLVSVQALSGESSKSYGVKVKPGNFKD